MIDVTEIFKGDPACLRWNMWDLAALDRALQLTPGRRSVIQAGGNLGVFAAALAPHFQAVYTFEPDPKLFPLLVRNAPAANIIRFQAALGSARALVSMDLPKGDAVHDGESFVAGPGITPTIQIDHLGIKDLDLLYLDVEGFEREALRGADDTIRICRPVIVCEVNKCCERYGYTGDDLLAYMSRIGYSFAERVHSDRIFLPVERQC